jgi:pyrophosphate--fructose-6-phosphate 1-phosphotransferase
LVDIVELGLSEGAGMKVIIEENEKSGETVLRDAFGHVKLDELNPGKWFAKKLAERLNANKILVQKSGYFGRSAKANSKDLELIFNVSDKAVESAIKGESGVVRWDEESNNMLSCINFTYQSTSVSNGLPPLILIKLIQESILLLSSSQHLHSKKYLHNHIYP